METHISDLPLEILVKIYEFLPFRSDKSLFRSVCKTWRSIIPQPPINPNFQFLSRPIPKLNDVEEVQFILVEYAVYYLRSTANTNHKGTMVKIYDHPNGQNIQFFHPFGSYSVWPPYGINLLDFSAYQLGKSYLILVQGIDGYIEMTRKVVTSLQDTSNGVQFNETFRFMGILDDQQLGHYTFGDNGGWSILEIDARFTGIYRDIVYRRNRFYIIDHMVNLRIVDSDLNSEFVGFYDFKANDRLFLLEAGGKLYLVLLRIHWVFYFAGIVPNRLQILVYCLIDSERKWTRVYDLGDFAFFVEEFSSFPVAITARFPQLRRNRIYFCLQDGIYVIYNLRTNKVRWLYLYHPEHDHPFLWPMQWNQI